MPVYSGQRLSWIKVGTWRATSGLPGFQYPKHQCDKDVGPVPEGEYLVLLRLGTLARISPANNCGFIPGTGIERIPPALEPYERCKPYWANWGTERVRFIAANPETRRKCTPERDYLYLHDSVKGFSHGCIETQKEFFDELRKFIEDHPRARHLPLTVRYSDMTTYGGTRVQ